MKNINDLLDDIRVEWDIQVENVNLDGWYGVSTTDGIIAYFSNETDALRFRLDYINQILNPL